MAGFGALVASPTTNQDKGLKEEDAYTHGQPQPTCVPFAIKFHYYE